MYISFVSVARDKGEEGKDINKRRQGMNWKMSFLACGCWLRKWAAVLRPLTFVASCWWKGERIRKEITFAFITSVGRISFYSLVVYGKGTKAEASRAVKVTTRPFPPLLAAFPFSGFFHHCSLMTVRRKRDPILYPFLLRLRLLAAFDRWQIGLLLNETT